MPSKNITSSAELLIEFLTEELPPLNLEYNIGQTFTTSLNNELKNFSSDDTSSWFFVTPRRFGCIISNIYSIEPQQLTRKKGPAIANALKDDQATPALSGFLKSCGIDNWRDLEQDDDGYFYAVKETPGHYLTQDLPGAIEAALKKLPIAKYMRWGNNDYAFVRPVQNLVILYDNQVICTDSIILGCSPVEYTFGHRIMSSKRIKIGNSSNYALQMHQEGKIIVNFDERKNTIFAQLNHAAEKLALSINDMPSLLDEVTALVEHPVILQGEFAADFLKVPQECLILSMAKNQKYFALLDSSGKLSNKFLFVANISSTNPQIIINGNQKVLAARLSDAKFFYDMDLKHDLNKFVAKLEHVVYHNQLGSQLQRVHRMQQISKKIAEIIQQAAKTDKNLIHLVIAPQLAYDTALLLKADLTTEMVGEFPELQGVMGKYYATAFGESSDVANAIEKHYYPRFSGDILPDTPLATIMALTDKLETLVGIWGIGLIPTGEKDPFALRRTILGVIRILLETHLPIKTLLRLTFESFTEFKLNSQTIDEVYNFAKQRLTNYLVSSGYSNTCVQSALAFNPEYFDHLPSLLDKLQQFAAIEDNKLLLNANKRIKNILEKNGGELSSNTTSEIKEALLVTNEEKALFELFNAEKVNIQTATDEQDWTQLFTILARFNQPVADFFANVMVMDKNENIRNNRIILLQHLYAKFNQACLLSELN